MRQVKKASTENGACCQSLHEKPDATTQVKLITLQLHMKAVVLQAAEMRTLETDDVIGFSAVEKSSAITTACSFSCTSVSRVAIAIASRGLI